MITAALGPAVVMDVAVDVVDEVLILNVPGATSNGVEPETFTPASATKPATPLFTPEPSANV
jgi:hypothetical protein